VRLLQPPCAVGTRGAAANYRAALAKWLQDNYGIYPALSGMGSSVKDSGSLSGQPMTSQQILVKSISSENLLKNVSLAGAGCRCISVAMYPNRSSDYLDPDFIARAGGDGLSGKVQQVGGFRAQFDRDR